MYLNSNTDFMVLCSDGYSVYLLNIKPQHKVTNIKVNMY